MRTYQVTDSESGAWQYTAQDAEHAQELHIEAMEDADRVHGVLRVQRCPELYEV